ncbi:MAG: hypothetical protein WCW17_03165 [Patescibacteria group bacterium]
MKNNIFKSKWISFLAIFTVVYIFFYTFQFNGKMPLYSGEDSFYHVGMAKFILEKGIVKSFPWLYYTIQNTNFVDHQLLFHLLIIPFIKIFGDNVGPKLMVMTSLSLAFGFLFLLFRENKLKYGFIYAIIILFTMPSDFYFRMSFIRVQAVAILFMVLTFYFIQKNKPLHIGILSFLFVWLYSGSVFLLAIIGSLFIGQLLANEKINWKIILYGLGGFTLGIIINPYFPKNISYFYNQLFMTGLGAKPYSGGEWRPYDTWYWVQISAISIMLFLTSLVYTISKNIKINGKTLAILIYTFFLLILQWKSKRFVEYWPFWASISAFLLIGQNIESAMQKLVKKNGLVFLLYIIVGILIIFVVYTKSYEQIGRAQNDTSTGINTISTKSVNDYLIKNSSEGDIVFTDDWDMFPYYFYYNRKNYYIVGLDPEFMNQFNTSLYKEFADISSGSDNRNLERIKNDFKAKWVLVFFDHQQFRRNLETKPELFKKEFDDGTYYLFRVL